MALCELDKVAARGLDFNEWLLKFCCKIGLPGF